jgi:hypothetical protein
VRQWTTNGDGVLILRQDRERSPAEAAQLARRVQVGRPRPVTPDRTRAARGLVASGRRGPLHSPLSLQPSLLTQGRSGAGIPLDRGSEPPHRHRGRAIQSFAVVGECGGLCSVA